MQVEEKAKLLTAESKPYKVDGNEGISHRVRVAINGEIFSCRSTEAQVSSLQSQIGDEGTAILKIQSRKENLSIELVSFVS